MIDLANAPELSLLVGALCGLVAGVLLGFVHFGALWWNSRLYLSGGIFRALAIQLLRFAMLIAALAALAQFGALPLLAGALGLFFARSLVLRRVGRAA